MKFESFSISFLLFSLSITISPLHFGFSLAFFSKIERVSGCIELHISLFICEQCTISWIPLDSSLAAKVEAIFSVLKKL